jgi:hypothetical protein
MLESLDLHGLALAMLMKEGEGMGMGMESSQVPYAVRQRDHHPGICTDFESKKDENLGI